MKNIVNGYLIQKLRISFPLSIIFHSLIAMSNDVKWNVVLMRICILDYKPVLHVGTDIINIA